MVTFVYYKHSYNHTIINDYHSKQPEKVYTPLPHREGQGGGSAAVDAVGPADPQCSGL